MLGAPPSASQSWRRSRALKLIDSLRTRSESRIWRPTPVVRSRDGAHRRDQRRHQRAPRRRRPARSILRVSCAETIGVHAACPSCALDLGGAGVSASGGARTTAPLAMLRRPLGRPATANRPARARSTMARPAPSRDLCQKNKTDAATISWPIRRQRRSLAKSERPRLN